MTAQTIKEEVLHPWRRVRELGRGAMGAVYEAVHVGTGERRALKLLLASRDALDPDDLARFAREAEVAARLAHPNVARVHGWRTEPWPPYLLLDLLPGGSLLERLQKGPLPPAEARGIAEQLADGLAHAHAQGVVHRDLKPGNVLFDERGRPRITDFGLARDLIALEGLTRTGELIGTPVYMSPEQALDAKRADPLSDVYGLGAILYAMLAGQPPIHGVANLIEAVDLLTSERPIPPPSSLNPGVPPELEAVCLRALEKDPADRWPSAADFRDALREVGDEGKRATAKRPRPRKVTRAAGLLGLWLLVAGATAAGVLWLVRRDDPPPPPQGPTGEVEVAEPTTTVPTAPVPTRIGLAAVGPPLACEADGRWPDLVHTHGWRGPGGQAWLSLCLRAKAEGPQRVALTLVRARLLVVAHESALGWDTNPSARAPGSSDLAQAGEALSPLLGRSLLIELDERGAPTHVEDPEHAWRTAFDALARELSRLAVDVQAWSRAYAPEGLQWTWGAAASLPALGLDEPLRLGARMPAWTGWETSGAIESLARASLVTATAASNDERWGSENNRPLQELEGRIGVWRGYLSAVNATRSLCWPPRADELIVPDRLLLPADPAVAPGTSGPLPRQVRRVGPTLAHAWPWGMPLAVLPANGRWIELGRLGAWTRIGWGGGAAWVETASLLEGAGPLARITTSSSPLFVMDDRREIGQVQQGGLVALEPGIHPGDAPVWFDERPGHLPRGRGSDPWWTPVQ